MKKWLVTLLVVTGCCMVFAGGVQEKSSSGEKKDVTITFATAATTGALYPLGSAICNTWSTKLPYIHATAQASNGGIQNLNLVADQEVQIGAAVTSIVCDSMNGEGKFKGHANPNVRILAGLYYNPNQVVVTQSSGINSLKDLDGKRFASGAPGSTTEVETNLHLTALGINYPSSMKVQYVGFTEAIDLMRNKQLDGAWIMAGTPTAAVTEMTSTAGGKLIGIDESLIEKLHEKYPWYAKYIIPAGTYANQTEDITTSAIKMVIFTDSRVSDDVIYDLTKAFWENLPELAESQKVLKSVSLKQGITDLANLPLHEGAARYYREAGILK